MNFIKNIVTWYKQKSILTEIVEWIGILLIVFVIRTIGFGLYQVPTGSMETTMLCGERFFADKFTPLFIPFKHGDVITLDSPEYPYSKNALVNWWQRYVWGPDNWTKRVIGIPGDHIQGKIEDGKPVVYRNGQKLDEQYVNKYPLIGIYNPGRVSMSGPLNFRSYAPGVPFDKQPFYRLTYAEVMSAKQILLANGYEAMRYPFTPNYAGADKTGKSIDVFDVQLGADEYWAMGDNRQDSKDSRYWGPLKRNLIQGKVKLCLYSIDTNESWGKFEIAHLFVFDLIRHPIDFWSRVRWSRCLRFVR